MRILLGVLILTTSLVACKKDDQERSVDNEGNCTDSFNSEYGKVFDFGERLESLLEKYPENHELVVQTETQLADSCSHFFGFHPKVSCKTTLVDKDTGEAAQAILNTVDHTATCSPFLDL